ncbi:hypothetical protein ABT024_05380 [Streptomyces sp. NPDC002812]|uniref:hypothetical protein n=1 Tax=Streptomyces sp. NPDC002812 TaxID=3154434 RepID=UPI00333361F0
MAAGWRFIAQRALTGEWLDWDVPLALSANPVRALSGPGSLTGTIEPEYSRLRGPDGMPVLMEWGTKLYLEIDGHIRWGGIVTRTLFDGAKMSIEAEGLSSYAHGTPFEGHILSGKLITPKDPYEGKDRNHDGYVDFTDPKQPMPTPPKPYTGPRKDAYVAFREVWEHILSRPGGDIGLQVDSHNLGELLGAADGSDPWELAWWNSPDCGQALDSLARDTPFDWVETHTWTPDHSQVEHRLRLGTPRLGRKRNDLRFADGENIVAIARPEGLGDEYASEVIVLGKGEGRAMRRAQVYAPAGNRLRRVATVTDKTLSSASALRLRGTQELAGRTQALQIPAIQIADHANARYGSWALGDDIQVQVHVPWVGDVSLWHRIVSDEISADGTCTLTLKRSDSFHY